MSIRMLEKGDPRRKIKLEGRFHTDNKPWTPPTRMYDHPMINLNPATAEFCFGRPQTAPVNMRTHEPNRANYDTVSPKKYKESARQYGSPRASYRGVESKYSWQSKNQGLTPQGCEYTVGQQRNASIDMRGFKSTTPQAVAKGAGVPSWRASAYNFPVY